MRKLIPGFGRYVMKVVIESDATDLPVLPATILPDGDKFNLRNDAGKMVNISSNEIMSLMVPKVFNEFAPVDAHAFEKLISRKNKALVVVNELPNPDFIKNSQRKYGKVTYEQAVDIRSRLAAGETAKNLAAEYKVHESNISLIKNNKIHNHQPE